jgi:threonine/homoserine/homoserine lactone efflux protein
MPPWPLLAAFLAASLALAVTPGPGVFYIVTRSLAEGRSAGLASVAGVALGNLGNALGASIGLGALFAISSTAFSVVRYAGAAWLLYLGIRMLRDGRNRRLEPAPRAGVSSRFFRDGFIVALLNPKTAVFFAAFLPQFMSPGPQPMLQSAVLGALFVGVAAFTDMLYALAAGAVAPYLGRAGCARAIGRYVAGGVFVGLGVLTAVSGTRAR